MYIVKKNNNVNESNSKKEHKSKGKSKYVFPYESTIKSGRYISIVEDAEDSTTSRGKEGITVYYKIKDAIDLYNRINKKVPESTPIKTYYIKQTYPVGTSFYHAFLDSMAGALDTNNINLDDTIGVIEYVTLSYNSKDSMGGYSEREWITLDEYEDYCINDYQSKKNDSNSISDDSCDESIENENEDIHDEQISNVEKSEDFEDEFDDFLPDDEDW